MAKKINVKLILELRGNGMGRNAIARTRHISVNSVGDVFHKADETGISYEDVRDMDDDSVFFHPLLLRLMMVILQCGHGKCAPSFLPDSGHRKSREPSKDFLLSDTAGGLAFSYFYYILVTVTFSFPIYETRYFLIAIEEQTVRISSL